MASNFNKAERYVKQGDEYKLLSYATSSESVEMSDGTDLQTKMDSVDINIHTTEENAKSYTDTKISELVNSAPETLDTLSELAIAIEEHQEVTDALNAAIINKVDKIDGKGLSTNDYTTDEQIKLSGISVGAEVNQNAFSNVVVGNTTISAEDKTDSLTINAGNNIIISSDASENSIAISVEGCGNANELELTTAEYNSLSEEEKMNGTTYYIKDDDSGINVNIDSALSSTSTNPVQNNVITKALANKSDITHNHNYAGSSSPGGVATNAIRLSNTSAIGSDTQPVYFNANGVPVKTTYTLGASVPSGAKFTDTNTTYSAGTGISLSGTTFSNSGVRSIATGSSNGTISVDTNGSTTNVAVKGLGSAAYTASTAYAAASHTHSYLDVNPAIIEMYPPATNSGYGGILDFHFNRASTDYTTRLWENASGQLTCTGTFTANQLNANDYLYFVNTGCVSTSAANQAIFISATGSGVTSLGTQSTYRFGTNQMQPGYDNVATIGSSNYRWKQLFAGTTTISTSDRNAKDNIKLLSDNDKYYELFLKLLPVSFTFIDGESGRTHIGFISQDVEKILEELDMTGLDFAGFCKDVKTKVVLEECEKLDKDGNVILDEDGNPETTIIDKEVPDLDEDGNEQYIYSLRYSEFIGLLTNALQKTISRQDKLEERILKIEKSIS